MTEDKDNLTEQPTPRKLEDAHERGRIARAPELQAVAGMLAAALVILFYGKVASEKIAYFALSVFGHLQEFQLRPEAVVEFSRLGFGMILVLGMPMMGACMLAGVLAGGLQTQFRLTTKVIEADPAKLNPIKGLKRIVSMEGLVRLGIESAKFLLVGSVVFFAVRGVLNDPIFYMAVDARRLGEFLLETSLSLLFRIGLALALIAIANYAYQRFKTHKSLMMTRQEVKDERRQSEGDPMVKMALRMMGRRLLQRQMLDAIPKADVIVTNPTHFAIALKYERGVDVAPIVLAKGQNAFARRIKELGARYHVPLVENKPIARMLFKYGKVGSAIPSQLYQAVAEILGFVYRTHRLYFHELKLRRLREE